MDRRDFLLSSTAAACCLNAGTTSAKEEVKPVSEMITPNTAEAIKQGLDYLARKQVKGGAHRGAFGTSGYASGVAVSALAGLAFLCSGSTPIGGRYSSNVRACTQYVIDNTKSTGYISSPGSNSNMYGHGFAMLYLSQIIGMSQNPEALKKLTLSVKMTCDIQNDQGGWRYQPSKTTGDLSLTICQIMALRAARDAGLQVSDEVRTKCIEFVNKCQNSDGSFHYTLKGGRTSIALTAAGIVSLYSAGIYEGEVIEKGLAYLMKHKPDSASGKNVSPMNYFYGQYYSVQAMWHAQLQHPEYWNMWYPAIRDELMKKRQGQSWPDSRVGPEYGTAMSCIILQMPNNYLPVFAP